MSDLHSTPLFFMHIGKTGGSHINQCFKRAFGETKVVEFCEHWIGDNLENKDPQIFSDKDVISGHVFFHKWTRFATQENLRYRAVTVVRNPVEHVRSIMRWLDSFNKPEHAATKAGFADDLRAEVTTLGTVDFKSASDLEFYFAHLSPFGRWQFDNLQSRFFVSEQGLDFTIGDDCETRKSIQKKIDAFAFIGVSEDVPAFLEAASLLTHRCIDDIPERTNITRSERSIDVEDRSIMAVLSRFLAIDLFLYDTVSKRRIPRHDMPV